MATACVGKLIDRKTGAPLIGITVEAINSTGTVVSTGTTDSVGRFSITGMADAEYYAHARYDREYLVMLNPSGAAGTITGMTSSNWKIFYGNGSGVVAELSLPAINGVLVGQGIAAAPIFSTTLAGLTLTSPIIGTILNTAIDLRLSQNSVDAFVSEYSGALVNTLYLKAGQIGIGTAGPARLVHLYSSSTSAEYLQEANGLPANYRRFNIVTDSADTASTYFRALNDAGSGGVTLLKMKHSNGVISIPASLNVDTIGQYTGAAGVTVTSGFKDKAGQVFNVKAYGAIGDDSTDDTAAIEAAMLACFNAGGGTVYCPQGTYIVNPVAGDYGAGYLAGIWLRRICTLKGAGIDSTIIKAHADSSDGSAIIFNRVIGEEYADHDIQVCDLTINGNNVAILAAHPTYGAVNGLKFWRARRIIVQNVKSTNCLGTTGSGAGEGMCFDASNCTDLQYNNCFAVADAGQTSAGFNVNSSSSVRYNNCVAYGFRAGAIGVGFSHNGNSGLQYNNCHAYLNTYAQFNSEVSKNVSYNNCNAGGETPDTHIPNTGVTYNYYQNETSLGGASITGSSISFDGTTKKITANEKVTNGTFTGSATGWTVGAAWGYNANAVDKNADGTTTLEQNVSVALGQTYYVTYTISNYSAGNVTVSLGGVAGTVRNSNGTYTEEITTSGTGNLIFTPSNTARFTIDIVSVRQAGFYKFAVGTRVTVTGSASNNSVFTITAFTAASEDTAQNISLTVSETVTTEAAGASVTLNSAAIVNGLIINGSVGVEVTGGSFQRHLNGIWIANAADNITIVGTDLRNNVTAVNGTATTLHIRACPGISDTPTTINGKLIAGSDGFGQADFGYDDGTSVWIRTLDTDRNLKLGAHGSGFISLTNPIHVDTMLEQTLNAGVTIDTAIFKGGNVGIGTAGPLNKLEVNGNISMGGYDVAAGNHYIGSPRSSDGNFGAGSSVNFITYLEGGVAGHYSGGIDFNTNQYGVGNFLVMSIRAADVGIGTIPAARLHSLSTTEQLRLGYNAAKYTSFTMGSDNILLIGINGATAGSMSTLNFNWLTTGTFGTSVVTPIVAEGVLDAGVLVDSVKMKDGAITFGDATRTSTGNWVSSKDYGALANGSTNDTTAWAATLAASKHALVTEGTSLVTTDTMAITTPNQFISGKGPGCILNAATITAFVFDANGTEATPLTNITFKDFQVAGVATVDGQSSGFRLNWCKYVTIQNMLFTNTLGSINSNRSRYSKYINNTILMTNDSHGGIGITLGNNGTQDLGLTATQSDYNLVAGNLIYNAGGYGIYVDINSRHNIISHNILDAIDNWGIYNDQCPDNIYALNQIVSPASVGIGLTGALVTDGPSSRNIVLGNQVFSAGNVGIHINQGTVTVNGNLVTSNKIYNSTTDGIVDSKSDDTLISGNSIEISGTNGIDIIAALRSMVSGNLVRTWGSGYNGIRMESGSQGVFVHGNYLNYTDTASQDIADAGTANIYGFNVARAMRATQYTAFPSSHNEVPNWSFEAWGTGVPQGWAKTGGGASAAVTQESGAGNFVLGSYSMKIVNDSAAMEVYYAIPNWADFKGKYVTISCYVKTSTASSCSVKLSDGVATSQSVPHTGGGGWEILTVTMRVSTSATLLYTNCRLEAANNTASYWDGAMCTKSPFAMESSPDLVTHTHADASQGAQLDWDTCWSDAVHNHSSAAEGGDTLALAANGLTVGTTQLVCSGGYVGIGTAGPLGKLNVLGSGTTNITANSDVINEVAIMGPVAPDANSANLSIQTNTTQAIDVGGTLGLGGRYNSADGRWATFGIIKGAKENATDTNYASYMSFATRANGGSNSEKLRIASTGLIRMNSYGAGTATFDASGNITSVSDLRFKDRIAPLPYGLAEVLRLKPVQHGYNELSGLEREHLYGGFIAQDVQKAMPLAVGKDARGYLTLADRPILGATVNAIKALEARIRELEARTCSGCPMLDTRSDSD